MPTFPPRLATLAMLLPLGACAAGERGLVSPHQPVVAGAQASVPGCPDWSDTLLPASEGQSTNYGCASALNLAAMIADPRDLVRGRTSSTTDTDQAVRAVRAWKDGKLTVDKQSAKGN